MTPESEQAHRDRVNVWAAIGIVLLLVAVVGIVKLFVNHEDLQRCVDSGRRNCASVQTAPREGVVTPVR